MTEPTDAEIIVVAREAGLLPDNSHPAPETRVARKHSNAVLAFARAVLAKWGTPPAVAGEPVAWLSTDSIGERYLCFTKPNDSDPVRPLVFGDTTPQPTQAQAGAVPLTPIRQAALDLYKPPFRHEHGYIRDANNQIVSDDASSVATGLIAARIRGWGRIQYMDKPEQRAAALQDEVAEMVAEALNAYWAADDIKNGGQHGAEH